MRKREFSDPAIDHGYRTAIGVFEAVCDILMWPIIIVLTYMLLSNMFGWGLDDSDKDGWNRSGLQLHTDHKTGVQYFSDGRGGLVPRVLPHSQPEEAP